MRDSRTVRDAIGWIKRQEVAEERPEVTGRRTEETERTVHFSRAKIGPALIGLRATVHVVIGRFARRAIARLSRAASGVGIGRKVTDHAVIGRSNHAANGAEIAVTGRKAIGHGAIDHSSHAVSGAATGRRVTGLVAIGRSSRVVSGAEIARKVIALAVTDPSNRAESGAAIGRRVIGHKETDHAGIGRSNHAESGAEIVRRVIALAVTDPSSHAASGVEIGHKEIVLVAIDRSGPRVIGPSNHVANGAATGRKVIAHAVIGRSGLKVSDGLIVREVIGLRGIGLAVIDRSNLAASGVETIAVAVAAGVVRGGRKSATTRARLRAYRRLVFLKTGLCAQPGR